MNTDIKFIYFDVGGVVLKFEHAFEEIHKKTGKSYDYIGEIFDKYAAIHGNDENKLLAEYKKELDLDFETYQQFLDFYTGAFIGIPETHALMKELIALYPLGLLSNTEPGVLPTSIKLDKIPDLKFHTIIASADVGYKKPDIKIFELAEEKAGYKGSNILFIDDIDRHLNGARQLGWTTIQFNTNNPQESVNKIKQFLGIE